MSMNLTISNGYVVYDRGKDSESPFWRYIYNQGAADAASLPTSLNYQYRVPELGAVGNTLITMGQAEEERERQVIFQCLGTQYSQDTSEFIREFNDILAQKAQLVSAMDKLKEFSSKSLRDAASNKQFSSHFVNHFGTTLNANLTAFLGNLEQQIDSTNFSAYESQIEEVVKQSINEALDKAIAQGETGEDVSFYAALQEVISIFPSFRGAFRDAVYSRFNVNNLQNIVSNRSVRPGSKRTGIRSAIDSKAGLNLKNLRNTTYFAKSLQEVVDNLINNMGTSAQASNGKAINISDPDSFQVFSIEQGIDFSAFDSIFGIDQFDDSQITTVISQLEQYYNQNLAQLDQSLVVYSPLQVYNTFEARIAPYGGATELQALDELFSHSFMSDKSGLLKFVEVARNVGSGAYFQDLKISVETELEMALMSAAADFLLQDWDITYRYGVSGNRIQVISLGGKYLPLSALYTAVGRAFIMAATNLESLVSVYVETPGEILYPEPIIIQGEDPMPEVLAAWDRQAQAAREEATFAIYFFQNFEQVVRSQLTF